MFKSCPRPAGDHAIGCNSTTEFDCVGDGKMCIRLDRVCDGKNDCGNWQDEPKHMCNVNECAGEVPGAPVPRNKSVALQLMKGGCDQLCTDLPIGFRCGCREGFQLVGNTTCEGAATLYIKKYNNVEQ